MKAIIWNTGAPPKRGAYRVKSDGPSANTGFRYWHGERWSGLSATRAWCIKANKDGPGRNTPLKYPVLWASPAPAGAEMSDERIRALCASIYLMDYQDEPGGYEIAIARAVLAARGKP